MITFKDNGSAVSIQFSDEQRYLYDGEMNIPKGSLSLVYDNSGMAIFRRSSNNDVLFECFPNDTNLGSESALTEFFTTSMVGEGVDLSDYYTKEEADAAIESAITESGGITSGQVESQIESALTAYTTTSDLNALLNNKQDTLVSGTNIKTINNQSLLGEGNITIEGGGGESYTAGNGITIAEGVISVDSNVVPSMDEVVDNDTYTAFTASTSSDISNLEKQDTALGGEIASHEQAFNAYTAATNATLANKADRSEIPSTDDFVENSTFTAYTANTQSALDGKADSGDVPTVQTSSSGGEGNYIYSNSSDEDHRCISDFSDTGLTTENSYYLRGSYWGQTNSTINICPISIATSTAAGLMRGNDKAKLDAIPSEVYSKSEIDSMIGDVETLLSQI